MMSPTYLFTNDKFNYSHERIVIKIEESLDYNEYDQFLNRLFFYNLIWTVYAFHKPPQSRLYCITCSKIEHIP